MDGLLSKDYLKEIPGHPGYRITKHGRVWSGISHKWLSTHVHKTTGYVMVALGNNHRGLRVHRLILRTFVGPCPEGMEGCHNDGIKTHNWLDNLRWDTPSGNYKDKVKHGTAKNLFQAGKDNTRPTAKLSFNKTEQIRELWDSGLYTQDDLAKKFNVTQSTISRVINNRTWKDE